MVLSQVLIQRGRKDSPDKERFVEALVRPVNLYLYSFEDHYIRKKFKDAFSVSLVLFPLCFILPSLHLHLFLK